MLLPELRKQLVAQTCNIRRKLFAQNVDDMFLVESFVTLFLGKKFASATKAVGLHNLHDKTHERLPAYNLHFKELMPKIFSFTFLYKHRAVGNRLQGGSFYIA